MTVSRSQQSKYSLSRLIISRNTLLGSKSLLKNVKKNQNPNHYQVFLIILLVNNQSRTNFNASRQD